MYTYLSALAQKVQPYTPGEQLNLPDLVKLNTNENPYPPSPRAVAAMKEAVDSSLRLYPNPNAQAFVNAVSEVYKADEDMVFVGNGSDEVLAFAFMAFFTPGHPAFFPDLTYSFYPVYARIFGIDTQVIPVRDDFSIFPADYTGYNGGIILANPNAPTSVALSRAQIEQIVKNARESVVIVDEAYVAFGGESVVDLTHIYKNLLVVNTLSKSHSLAGLRAGYAVGHRNLIDGLNRIKNCFNSYTMDRIAIAGAAAAILDPQHARENCEKIMATRDSFCRRLMEMDFSFPAPSANFVFATHESVAAADIFHGLRERGILVRYFDAPRLDNYLRISIGTDKQMDRVADELEKIIDELDA